MTKKKQANKTQIKRQKENKKVDLKFRTIKVVWRLKRGKKIIIRLIDKQS